MFVTHSVRTRTWLSLLLNGLIVLGVHVQSVNASLASNDASMRQAGYVSEEVAFGGTEVAVMDSSFIAAVLYEEGVAENLRHVTEQLDGLRSVYEDDKRFHKQDHDRFYLLIFFVSCGFFVLVVWGFFSRKAALKYLTQRPIDPPVNQQALPVKPVSRPAEIKVAVISVDKDRKKEADNPLREKLGIALHNLFMEEKIYRRQDLSREYVIKRLGINRKIFGETFHYFYGVSLTEYTNNLRLEDAIRMLETTDHSIEVISNRSGFGSVRSFQRQFQIKYNLSPKEYRNQHRRELV